MHLEGLRTLFFLSSLSPSPFIKPDCPVTTKMSPVHFQPLLMQFILNLLCYSSVDAEWVWGREGTAVANLDF